MKIAITRLSGNLTDKNKLSVGNAEMINIAKMLRNINVDIDILTCKTCEDAITVHDDYNINQYDALLVVNDSTDMFGGLEITTMTTIYKLMHKFKKQIYYILTDLSLPFVDYYQLIKGKTWANKYNENDFKLQNDIIILSQAHNLDIVKTIHKNINIKDIKYVPWHYWKLYSEEVLSIKETLDKKVDLIYGGSFRSGRREKKFIDYFFDKNINVEIYGNMKLSQFKNIKDKKPPIFTDKIENTKILEKNKTSLATIILGDKNYNNNIVTLRYIEALMSQTICFIDNDFDTSHTLMHDKFYVKNGKELEEKIINLKQNQDEYYDMLNIQNIKLLKILSYDLPRKVIDILERNII